MSQRLPLQASAAVWKSRALRYTALYVVLVCVLLGLRYATYNTYPQLRELRGSVAELQIQRDQLELEVQALTTGPRVLAWATAQGMRPYAQAAKTTTEIAPLPDQPGLELPVPAPLTPAPPSGTVPSSAAPAQQTSGTDPPALTTDPAFPDSAVVPTRPRLEVITRWK